jgi:glycine betaine catabolism A
MPARPSDRTALRAVLRETVKPHAQARMLPRDAYGDVGFGLDRALFAAGWVYVAHESEWAPRSYLAFEAFGERIVVSRDRAGELHGFFDRCLHRGTPLTEGCGTAAEELRCPYHGLRYGLDRTVVESSAAGFCLERTRLATVRVARWRGMVFAAWGDAPELAAWLGDAPPWLQRAELEKLRVLRSTRHVVAANWKLLVENFQESHHFPSVHPALEAATPWRESSSVQFDGPWLGGVMPLAGVDTVALGGGRGDRPFVAAPEDRAEVHDALLFPAWLTSLQPDYFLSYRLMPLAADRTEVVASIFVHASARDDASEVTRFWDVTNAEDRAICERQQRGVAAPGFEPGLYAEVEDGMHAFDARVARAYLTAMGENDDDDERERNAPIVGIFGQPYQRLEHLVGEELLDAIDREVTVGLSRVESGYTGGSLKWMGVVAPWCMDDGYRDLMHAIEAFTPDELAEFVALADDPSAFDLDGAHDYQFGDETEHPLNRAQMRYLAYRHGVYFPWKVCYHLLENDRWEDKHSGTGKNFGEEALEVFPRTIAAIRSLPFREIGRAVIFGLEPNDHAPLHRDSEPGNSLTVAQSITIDPRGNKRFHLQNAPHDEPLIVDARVYWFNDMDYHGVLADPFFRYSIRIDGQFDPAFVRDLERRARR